MNERTRHLRIKIINLADEARTIRSEERKTAGMEKWNLQHHRKTVVRSAARANLLAYAFLRGIPYSKVERYSESEPNWTAIGKTALRFGGEEDAWTDWEAEAKAHFRQMRRAA